MAAAGAALRIVSWNVDGLLRLRDANDDRLRTIAAEDDAAMARIRDEGDHAPVVGVLRPPAR